MFWCVLHYFANVKTSCVNMVRVVDRMHETVRIKFLQIFLTRTCTIHIIKPKTHVLIRFSWLCQSQYSRYEHGSCCAPDARNCLNEASEDYFATNMPNPPYWTQNSCFDVFRAILLIWKWQVRSWFGLCTRCTKLCEQIFWIFFFATNVPNPPY